MKVIFLNIIVFTALNVSAFAGDDNVDPLANIQISKSDISKSLDNLKSQGKISATDYDKAKKEVDSLSDVQVTALKETAIGMVRNNPDKAVDLFKADKFDAAQTQKQIEDLSKPN